MATDDRKRVSIELGPKALEALEHLKTKWECAGSSETIRLALIRCFKEEHLLETEGGELAHFTANGEIKHIRYWF